MGGTAKLGAVLAAVGVLVAVVVVVVSNRGPETKRYFMPAESMEPTIKVGDHFEAEGVDDYAPKRGDIVVFEDPGGWLAPAGGDGRLVKRIIGIPGDTIVCCDTAGRLSVNGEPLDEPYLRPGADCAGPMLWNCDWTAGPVSDDGLFVMGDNRANSADSTVHMCSPRGDGCDPDQAYVPITLVIGVVKE